MLQFVVFQCPQFSLVIHVTLFAFCESTKVSHKKRGQSMTPRAFKGRCCYSLLGTGGSVGFSVVRL